MRYEDFLRSKVKLAPKLGIDLPADACNLSLMPHQAAADEMAMPSLFDLMDMGEKEGVA